MTNCVPTMWVCLLTFMLIATYAASLLQTFTTSKNSVYLQLQVQALVR